MNYFIRYTLWIPFRCFFNWVFCLKYPFWKSRNVFTDEFCGYRSTWYDDIPKGWKKAFGKQLSKELKEALIKDNLLNDFRFSEIKEKWGELCLYCSTYGNESGKVISKYEELSKMYCINCGNVATKHSKGLIENYCEKCAKTFTV